MSMDRDKDMDKEMKAAFKVLRALSGIRQDYIEKAGADILEEVDEMTDGKAEVSDYTEDSDGSADAEQPGVTDEGSDVSDESEDEESEDGVSEDDESGDDESVGGVSEDEESEDSEFEDDESEDDESEDSAFEDNESEDEESEDSEFEDNESEDKDFEDAGSDEDAEELPEEEAQAQEDTTDSQGDIDLDMLGEDALAPERQNGTRGEQNGGRHGRRGRKRPQEEYYRHHFNVGGTIAAAAAICLVAIGVYQSTGQRGGLFAVTSQTAQTAEQAPASDRMGADANDDAQATDRIVAQAQDAENGTESAGTAVTAEEAQQAMSDEEASQESGEPEGAGSVAVTGKSAGSGVPVEEQTVANPWTDFDTLEEAEKAAGMTITVPDSADGFTPAAYRVMDGSLLEIIYENDKGEEGLRIRKCVADSTDGENTDISGDYNSYSSDTEEKDITVATDETQQQVSAELKSDGDIVKVALWSAQGTGDNASTAYTYSITFDGAQMSAADVRKLISEIY